MKQSISGDRLRNVLVVEDNLDMLHFLRASLKKQFHKVEIIEISNGIDALEKLSGTPPDLLILDICLPGINGFELLHIIRKRGGKRKTKIIAISGSIDKLNDICTLGVDAALRKPFSSQELQDAIKKILCLI